VEILTVAFRSIMQRDMMVCGAREET
jgi:hypothetical protein